MQQCISRGGTMLEQAWQLFYEFGLSKAPFGGHLPYRILQFGFT